MPRHQFLTFLGILLFVALGVAATHLKVKERNLKVLPKDISDQALDSIMLSYNKALNVKCDFCHAVSKTNRDELDFASDDNHMKDDARRMIRLTIQVNKDYFYFDTLKRPEFLNVVSCITCHRGDPFPADLK